VHEVAACEQKLAQPSAGSGALLPQTASRLDVSDI
jgi:hypothetical protein